MTTLTELADRIKRAQDAGSNYLLSIATDEMQIVQTALRGAAQGAEQWGGRKRGHRLLREAHIALGGWAIHQTLDMEDVGELVNEIAAYRGELGDPLFASLAPAPQGDE